jgi:EF-hand domain
MHDDVGSCHLQALNHPWLREQGVASDRPMDSVVITRIQQFAANSRFKKAAISVMASCLTPAELSGLEHLFQSIDADGNGTITAAELKQALQSMGSKIPDNELQVTGRLALPCLVVDSDHKCSMVCLRVPLLTEWGS